MSILDQPDAKAFDEESEAPLDAEELLRLVKDMQEHRALSDHLDNQKAKLKHLEAAVESEHVGR